MARASFSGTLRIGELVSLGVKAYALVPETEGVLHILHKPCRAPVEQEHRCKLCGKLIPDEDKVKGVEHKGRWVVIDDDDLNKINPENGKGIMTVDRFVPPDQINPLWIHRNFHLVPAAPEDAVAYATIARACRQSKRAVVMTFVSHNKDHLAVIRPVQDGMMMHTLHFATQIRTLELLDIEVDEIDPPKELVTLTQQLIGQLSGDFTYANYQDVIAARLEKLIADKAAKKPIKAIAPIEEPAAPGVISLKDALQKSINLVKARKKSKKH